MFTPPDLHDGFFDGLWLSEDKFISVFVRTEKGERSTLVLRDLEALRVSDLKAGNIIFDLVLIDLRDLTPEHIKDVYQLQLEENAQAEKLLKNAKERRLSLLQINPSYGAECNFLFGSAEILAGHIIPLLDSR